MTTPHEADDLTCPRCGAPVTGFDGTIDGIGENEQIRINIECGECKAPLEIVVESTLPKAVDAGMWVEDRREGE